MSLSRFSLAGKVAVVTCSGRDLGCALAKGIAEAGAAIITSARTFMTGTMLPVDGGWCAM